MIVLFSICAIQASDVNVTEFDAVEDMSVEIEDGTESADINIDDDILADNNKNQTQMVSLTDKIYYAGQYSISLKDSNSNAALANKNIDFIINNIKYINTTNNDGIALINLNLGPGTYAVTATFAGDDDYDSSNLSSQIKILPTINARDVTKYYRGSQKYTATFFDSYGNVLKDAQINITVNGKSYSKKTNDKGVVSLKVNLNPGTYKVVATDPISGYKLTTNFKILSTISASDLKKVRGDDRKFSVKFFKSDGKALANKQVTVKINGITYKYKTNSKGKVKLSFKSFKKGKYSVVCYNVDGLSQANTVQIYNMATTKLTLNPPNTYTIFPNGSKNVKIKFSTKLGGDTKAGKTIKITIDGNVYYRKTDSKGVINFKLPVTEGVFTVGYDFVGDKFFKASKAANSVTVLKTNDTKFKVKGLKSFGYGAGTLFKVAFRAGNVLLVQKTVTFTIDGKTYKAVTDSKGIASMPINLNIGNYTVGYSAPSDATVKGTSGTCDINVFKRDSSKFSWQSAKSYKDDSQSFKVLLVNSKGQAISGGIVKLTIDGVTYTGKTESNGYATFTTQVALGKYNVSVKFLGTNDYLPTSISKSINVKLSKFGKGLNVKDSSHYSSAYLGSTSHCQVNNAKIKTLVKSLTSGLTNNIDKAKALFNYVRDEIVYDYYYDSKHGAVGTLNAKSGNCVDQAHLLISMYRTAGFKARYVHGTCVFSDGTFGHVWTQVLIDNTWIVGDPISYKNSLGKIKNWNVNNYRFNGRYLSLPF